MINKTVASKSHAIRFFSRMAVQQKIIVATLLTLFIAMLIAAITFTGYDARTFKDRLQQESRITAKIISKRSIAAVMFRDKKAAQTNLDVLAVQKSILLACIFNAEKQVFVVYPLGLEEQCKFVASLDVKTHVYADYFSQTEPIAIGKRTVGWLYVRTSLDEAFQRTIRFLIASVVILLGSLVLAFIITNPLRRQIVAPILHLSNLTNQVQITRDYSVRAVKESDDEIGGLADDMNSMLHHIQTVHLQLTNAMEELTEKNILSEDKADTAELSTKRVKDFFAGASHDLKQPLAAMGLFINALEDEPLGPTGKRYLSKLGEAADNLDNLFGQLLDAGRFEEKLIRPDLEVVNMDDLFNRLRVEFEVMANDKNLILKVHCANVKILSNKIMIERIMRNLLSNAIRYTEQGGILLACRGQGEMIRIQVFDTGMGISPDQCEIIFDPYMQLNNPEHSVDKGFGLGLSIVKRLSDSLGHEIKVRSTVGQGTCFQMLASNMGKTQKKTPTFEQKDPPNIQPYTVTNPLENKLIWVIEDDVLLAEALVAVLTRWQANALIISDLDEVTVLLQQHHIKIPDLFISDFYLTETLSGPDVIEFVEDSLQVKLKGCILSAEADEKILQRLGDRKIPILKKPLKPAALRATLVSLLKH